MTPHVLRSHGRLVVVSRPEIPGLSYPRTTTGGLADSTSALLKFKGRSLSACFLTTTGGNSTNSVGEGTQIFL